MNCSSYAAGLLGVSTVMLAIGPAEALTRVWKGEGTGTSVTTASDLGDAQHWFNGVPESQDDCYFTNCPPNVWNFIKADQSYTLSGFYAQHWQTPKNLRDVVFVSDYGLNFAVASKTSSSLLLSPHIYADISSESRFMSWTLYLCGDFSSTLSAEDAMGQYTLAAGTLHHRLDRYANAPGGVRTNPMAIDSLCFGNGIYALYAPRGTDAPISGTWRQTAGSPYLFPVSGSAADLPVGAAVTGEGIPADTFLRRIFPDGSIELSNAADSGSEANELTFGALAEVAVSQRFEFLFYGGDDGERTIALNKYRDTDELTVRIGRLSSGKTPSLIFNTTAGFKPGTLVFEDASGLQQGATLRFRTCHVELEGAGGFAKQAVTLPAAGERAEIGVPAGVSAQLGASAKGLAGTLVKVGEGELALNLTSTPSANTGLLQVSAGSVRLYATETAPAQAGRLALADGTRIVLDGGEVTALSLTVEGTAVVSGTGTLVVPSGTDFGGLRFEDGAKIRLAGASAVVNWTSPAGAVVGCPAVWVDASQESTITEVDGLVSRIDDVRGAEHFYATASSEKTNMRPFRTKTCGLAYVEFPIAVDKTYPQHDSRHYGALVWNRKITGIRAVFLVQDTWNGGGEILGSTSGVSDFARPAGLDWTYLVIWSGAAQCVKDAACYVNGERRNLRDMNAYPYCGGNYTGNGNVERWLPNVTEVHPTAPGAKADCWGMDPTTDQHGQLRLCECLVYTNELTEAERLSVASYLSRKWVGREISYERYAGAGLDTVDTAAAPSFSVAAGESVAVKTVTGDGTFGKDGDGTLTLLGCGEGNASLVVSGGKMVVGSGLDETAIPDGAFMHLDASKAGTIVTGVKNGREYVKSWKDVRPSSGMSVDSIDATTNAPCVKTVPSLQNLPVVDFGPWSGVSYVNNTSPQLDIKNNGAPAPVTASSGLRTEIVVLGSARGGGLLISGGDHGFNETYGVTRSGDNFANALVRYDGDTGSVPTKTYTHAYYPGVNAAIRRNDIRVNGTPVLGTQKDVLSGAYDLVTFSVYDAFGATCFGAHHYKWFNGGGEMGEVLLYREQLASQTIDRIEAYLGKKWFGRSSADYPAAKAASVLVAAGAELELKGGDPLTTGALAGAGRIAGDVALAADGRLDVAIVDGDLPTLTVSGVVSGDGRVVLTGNLDSLEQREYKVLQAAGLTGTWTLDNQCGKSHFICNISQRDGAIYLRPARPGMMLLVK